MKLGPVIAMIGLIGLGVWLVAGSSTIAGPSVPDGHSLESIRVGTEKLWIETWADDEGEHARLLDDWGETISEPTFEELGAILGGSIERVRPGQQPNYFFRFLNISGWFGMIWVAVGFGGQIAFFGRMFIQWVVSEKRRQSVVPPMFWYLSLLGGVCLFLYFVWRKDIVGVLGQSSGVVIYARNVRLILKQRRREARRAATDEIPSSEETS